MQFYNNENFNSVTIYINYNILTQLYIIIKRKSINMILHFISDNTDVRISEKISGGVSYKLRYYKLYVF